MNLIKLLTKKNRVEVTRKGLIFIPDISGFTELVRSTDLLTGRDIAVQLLSTLVDNNILGLEIAEIEGDAVFFYRWGRTLPINRVIDQFHKMKMAFEAKRQELEAEYGTRLNVQLKAVAHYGEMSEFSLGGFHKLYGQVVVEAHSLLKNSVPEKSYLLVTDELREAAEPRYALPSSDGTWAVNQLCELYAGLRQICYSYTVLT